ncbi:unnamed protein product [Closterium sp. NIES-65]|nr:unnamed protein product [Closterium sp. NIES-65]CAI6008334.1 unnamed protein product [Closterium sp. NIES-65]
MSDCGDIEVVEGFSRLMALKAFCFSRHRLSLLEDLGPPASLEALRLHGCENEYLPDSFYDMSSLTSLELNAFDRRDSHVVDISQLSQLRVLKLNRVGVKCSAALCWKQSSEEQLDLFSEGEGRKLPLLLPFIPCLLGLASEKLEMLEELKQVVLQKEVEKLEQLEQLEMRLHNDNRELPFFFGFPPSPAQLADRGAGNPQPPSKHGSGIATAAAAAPSFLDTGGPA